MTTAKKNICKLCARFFKKYQCSAFLGECDCPECQGLCECDPPEEEVP
jgi:hypothetical protein